MTDRQVYLSLGSGVRLIDEQQLYDQFKGLGMSKKAFRAWMKCLNVPVIHAGTSRLYNLVSVQMALTAISRVGERDFYAPGSYAKRKLGRVPSHGTDHLADTYWEENFEEVLSNLLAARRINGMKITSGIREIAKKAAHRMTMAALQMRPVAAQADYDARTIKNAVDEGVLKPLQLSEKGQGNAQRLLEEFS